MVTIVALNYSVCCVGGYKINPSGLGFKEILVGLSFLLIYYNGINMIFRPQSWVIQALVTLWWNCANHKVKKDTLNWPCTQQNYFNLSPKSSLKWKICGNGYKSLTILFGYIPPLVLGCFLQSQHAPTHVLHGYTTIFNTSRVPCVTTPPWLSCVSFYPVYWEREANCSRWTTAWWYWTFLKPVITLFSSPGVCFVKNACWVLQRAGIGWSKHAKERVEEIN